MTSTKAKASFSPLTASSHALADKPICSVSQQKERKNHCCVSKRKDRVCVYLSAIVYDHTCLCSIIEQQTTAPFVRSKLHIDVLSHFKCQIVWQRYGTIFLPLLAEYDRDNGCLFLDGGT